ncbi:hypothetical protein GCM10009855_08250 [Gordonia cholesterolivorans]|uniref:Uncharacterized protein n=1 Tax=Gordonia cholesterolivorans TaxID=559625 RepID=A0ABN3H790_9ACTN
MTYAVFVPRSGADRSASVIGAVDHPSRSTVSTVHTGNPSGAGRSVSDAVSSTAGEAESSTYRVRSAGWSGSTGT